MKKWGVMLLVCLIFFIPTMTAHGATNISAKQTVNETQFLADDTVEIDGIVNGDVYAFGTDIIVNGTINGDLIGAAQNVVVNGKVNGNIRVATFSLEVNGVVERNVLGAVQHVIVSEDGVVAGDMIIASDIMDINGEVGKSIFGITSEMNLAGAIRGNLRLEMLEGMQFFDEGQVEGNFSYTSKDKLVFDEKRVGGKVTFKQEQVETEEASFSIMNLLMSLLMAIGLWGVLRTVFYKGIPRLKTMFQAPLKTFGFGALALFIGPVAAILVMVTIVLIPISILYLVALVVLGYVSNIFVGIAFGYELVKRTRLSIHPYLQELLGVLILVGLLALPVVGWILQLLVILLFIGFVIRALTEKTA